MSYVLPPYPAFFDSDGTALESGYIYIGEASQDARTNPIAIYSDEALTVPLAQPVRTVAGFPSYQGAPLRIYTAEATASITVLDRNGTPVVTNAPALLAGAASDIEYQPASTGAVATSVARKLHDFVSLTDFGPSNNGDAAEDRAAFVKAFAAMQADTLAITLPPEYFSGTYYTAPGVFVPPGEYWMAGGLASANTLINLWCIPGTVAINITDDTYWMTPTGQLFFFALRGFRIVGGKGALHQSYTGNNVTQRLYLEDNIFFAYTEAAVVSDAGNMPYWTIQRNQFYCDPDSVSVTKGLVLGGLLDTAAIRDNAFLLNRIHMQIGPLMSGSMNIVNNDFLSFVADYTQRDIWIIPNDTVGDFGTNSGQAVLLDNNRFGNENITDYTVKAERMLIAAATITAGNRATAVPNLTWKNGNDGANWLRDLLIVNNRINTTNLGGTDGPDASFCMCYIEKLDAVLFQNNPIAGGRFNYLFEQVDGGTRRASKDNTNSRISLVPQRGSASPVRYGISNGVMGFYDNSNGAVSGPSADLPPGLADPGAASISTIEDYTDWIVESGSVTLGAATDRAGGSTASAINFPSTALGVYWLFTPAPYVGLSGWLSLDVGTAGSDPVTGLQIIVTMNYSGGGGGSITMLDEIIPMHSTGFQTSAFQLDIPSDATGVAVYVRAPYRTSSADNAILGNAQFSAGRTPVDIPPA